LVDYRMITDQARLLLRGSVDPDELMNLPLDLFGAELLEAAYAPITIEPLCKSTRCALAKAFLAEGNATRARQQFQPYRRMRADGTGYAPSEQFVSLVTTAAPLPPQPSTKD
jgi:hypothetical protein